MGENPEEDGGYDSQAHHKVENTNRYGKCVVVLVVYGSISDKHTSVEQFYVAFDNYYQDFVEEHLLLHRFIHFTKFGEFDRQWLEQAEQKDQFENVQLDQD